MLTDTTRRLALGLLGLLLLTATACGSSGDGDAGESAAGATTTTSAPADAGSDAGDGPTLEQCEAVGDVVAGGASVDDATALFPEDLQDDVAQLTEELQAFLDAANAGQVDETDPQPTPSTDLAAFLEPCQDLYGEDDPDTGGGDPVFTYESMQVGGGTAVVTVNGTCSGGDGSFPVDVELFNPFGDPIPATDQGDGTYEFTVDVATTATEEQLIDELGLGPDEIDANIDATCP